MIRGLELWSEVYDLSGRADAVEYGSDGVLVPVEYKMGAKHGDAAEVQLCAQALCLEEMFSTQVREGAVWYSGPRCRERVSLDEALRGRTLAVLAEVKYLFEEAHLPPSVNDGRCTQCQLQDVCLPSVVENRLR